MKKPGHHNSFLLLSMVIAVLTTALFTKNVLAAISADGFWSDIEQSRITVQGQRLTIPERYRITELALPEFEAALATAPMEKSATGGILITLPMPDGSFQNFLVESSPIMAPELAQRHPEIATFIAIAEDNPIVTGRLDLTPSGFHAIIFTPQGTVYIDPYQSGSRQE